VRVLVVDDEPLARRRIEDLLRHEPDVTLAATAGDGAEALKAIRSLRPDLVFLDIQMPGMTGLEVVDAVGPAEMPATIFVTAYDRHAIRAFEVAAVDYLVKPFDDERFAQALARARERIRLREVERATRRLLSALGDGPAKREAPPASYLAAVPVESRGTVEHVPVLDIDSIVARGPYAELHAGGRTHLVRQRMEALERRLDPARFVRIHRSAIVQVDRIQSIRRRPGGEAVVRLADGRELSASRSRRAEVERRWAAVRGASRPQ
jgi:two-component system LytT family response regulator